MNKFFLNNKFIITILILILAGLSLFLISFAQNFLGPNCAAGQCQGKIGVDSSGNISIGTSTPQSNTRAYIIGATSDSSAYGLKIISSNSSPVLWVRNDGRVSIATTTFNYVLNIEGDIYTSGNLIMSGNLSAPISAGNVTPGVFNSLQGGGTGAYAFLGALGVATTSQVGLPQTLSVYGGGYFSGKVGIGTTNPNHKLEVNGAVSTTLLYLPNTFSSSTGVIYMGIDPFIHTYADPSSQGANTFVGLYAGNFTMGPGGGQSRLGSGNSAFGSSALYSNTTGYYNSAFGMNALVFNTTGYYNSAFGARALESNGPDYENSAFGVYALYANSGSYNSAFGSQALYSNSGSYNSAFGAEAFFNKVKGSYSSAFGARALYYNASSTANTAVGFEAGSGTGIPSGYSNQGGVYLGYQAGYSLGDNSNYNTLIGYRAGYDVSTGQYNIIIGPWISTGVGITTGSNNILIGRGVGVGLSPTGSNQLNIGNLIFGTGLGFETTMASGNVGIGTSTPAYKLDVQGGQINASGGLCIAGDCKTSWSQVGGGGFWTQGSGGIYYTGNVSVGTSTISYPLFVSTSTDNLFAIQRAGATYPTIFKQGTDGAFIINNNNSDIFTIKSGNVGIGTTNPQSTFHILQSSPKFIIQRSNDADGAILSFVPASPISSSFVEWDIGFSDASSTDLKFIEYNGTSWNSRFVIQKSTGWVGIGKDPPSGHLTVSNGAIDFIVYPGRYWGGSSYISDNNWVNLDIPGIKNINITDNVVLNAGTRLGIGPTSPSTMLDLQLFPGQTTDFFNVASSTGVSFFRITNSGNVGIGTTTPSYKLDVQGGQINASGGLCIAGDCKTSWSQVGGGGFWTQGSGGIYYTGNVSVGTSTISYPLFVSTSTDNLFAIQRAGATYPTIFKQGTDGAFIINNNNSDIFTIKSGNIGIGTTTPSYNLTVNGSVGVAGGSIDFGSATSFIVPKSSGAAPTSAGDIRYDTNQNKYVAGGGTGGNTGSFSRVLYTARPSSDSLNCGVIGTTDTNFSTTYNIPANFFIADKILRVTLAYRVTTSASPPNFTTRIKASGTTIFQSDTASIGANISNSGHLSQFIIVGTGPPGASVGVETSGPLCHGNIGFFCRRNVITQPVNLATNSSLTLQFSLQCSAGTAGNIVEIRQVIIEELN